MSIVSVLLCDISLVNRISKRIENNIHCCYTCRLKQLFVLRHQRWIDLLIFYLWVFHPRVFFILLVFADDALDRDHALELFLFKYSDLLLVHRSILFPDPSLETLILEDAWVKVTHM